MRLSPYADRDLQTAELLQRYSPYQVARCNLKVFENFHVPSKIVQINSLSKLPEQSSLKPWIR